MENNGINKGIKDGGVLAYLLFSLAVVIVMGLGYNRMASRDVENVPAHDMRIKAPDGFWVTEVPTPNTDPGTNAVEGIVLHHTATESAEKSLEILTNPKKGVSCHVLIDTDGSRYVLAPPEAITWHAGRSRLNGKEKCNNFTVGIEFQGNTLEEPLTDRQVESAVDYMLPIIKEHGISLDNVVTHEQVRANYINAHPRQKTPTKVDVTPVEHERVLEALRAALEMEDTGERGAGSGKQIKAAAC